MPKSEAAHSYIHPVFEQLLIAVHAEVAYRSINYGSSTGGWSVSRQWVAENPAVWGAYCTERARIAAAQAEAAGIKAEA